MFSKPVRQTANQNDRMFGVCGTCKKRVECFRHQTRTDRRGQSLRSSDNPFGDVPHSECPQCGAAVYMCPVTY